MRIELFFFSKKIKRSIAIAFLLIASTMSFGQIVFKGNIKDNSGKPLSYVSILLLKDTSIIIKGIGDVNGRYNIISKGGVPDGTFTLQFLRVGYLAWKKNIYIDHNSNAEIIQDAILEEASELLKEVSVKASRPIYENKIDRFVFNIEISTLATGSSAYEAISKLPGLIVNNSSINLVGKSGVIVSINGKRLTLSGDELLAYLSGISSDNISKIEIIANPGAQYDASGNSGIVNIVLKRSKLEGLLGFSNSTYEQRTKPSFNQNVNLNYRYRNINVYGFSNWTLNKYVANEETDVYFPISFWNNVNTRMTDRNSTTYQLGVDFDFGKKGFLSIVSDGNIYTKSNEKADAITKIYNKPATTLDSLINLQNNIHRGNNIKNVDVSFKKQLDTLGSTLNLAFDYLHFSSWQNQDLFSLTSKANNLTDSFSNRSHSPQIIDNFSFKADVDKQLTSKKSFSFGIKYSQSSTDNNYAYIKGIGIGYLNDITKSNHFTYFEKIAAGYASYSQAFNKSSIQLGVRGEYTEIESNSRTLGSVNKQRYFKLFPSVFYMYTFNANNRINFSYGIRINRPAFWELNPFKYFSSTYSFAEGNPNLMPSYAHNFQLVYSLKNKYFATLYIQLEQDHFQQVPFVNIDSNYYYYTRRNIGNITRGGILFYVPFQIGKKWNSNIQLNFFNISQTGYFSSDVYKYNIVSAYLYSGNQFQISPKQGLTAELNFMYNSPTQSYTSHSAAYSFLDIGIKKLFKNKKSSLSFNIYDVFHTYPYLVNVNYKSQQSNFINRWESRFAKVSYFFRFGKQTIKDRRYRQMGNSDERNRIN